MDELSITDAYNCMGGWSQVPLDKTPQVITPLLVSWLKGNPKLHSIHFDDERIDNPHPDPHRQPAGLIWSITSRTGETLLHIRLLVHNVELHDPTDPELIIHRRFLYTHSQEDLNGFLNVINISQPFYQDYTDYQGYVVPLSVLDGVERVEGIKNEGYWGKRGVEVGDKAWEVINTWREGLDRERGELSLGLFQKF